MTDINTATISEKIIKMALLADKACHKQWYLEMLAENLDIDLSDSEHEQGITP